ncbi:hypothetical protein [Candidatus Albibeggiatoa sp. nov. BB20]|uniref:hypothetical protein n=1 Tax=Candidatus Albibeggiatoa sp. nov. BB20 TaxID=3162723 RepID=UPI0033658597
MDIFGFSLQEIYVALIISIAAFLVALFATWFSHRFDKQAGDRNKPKRRKKTFR